MSAAAVEASGTAATQGTPGIEGGREVDDSIRSEGRHDRLRAAQGLLLPAQRTGRLVEALASVAHGIGFAVDPQRGGRVRTEPLHTYARSICSSFSSARLGCSVARSRAAFRPAKAATLSANASVATFLGSSPCSRVITPTAVRRAYLNRVTVSSTRPSPPLDCYPAPPTKSADGSPHVRAPPPALARWGASRSCGQSATAGRQ